MGRACPALCPDLGIRTFDTATALETINFGRGFSTEIGEMDLRVTAKDGSTVDVNLDTAKTIGDVITLINDAATLASVNIVASLVDTGNGIVDAADTAVRYRLATDQAADDRTMADRCQS